MRGIHPFWVGIALAGSVVSGCGSSPPAIDPCPAADVSCATAVDKGGLEGDSPNTVPISVSGSGEQFISVRVTEVSFDPRSISVRGTVSSQGDASYALDLYVDLQADASPCGLTPIASVNGVVDANWPDLYDGSSQDRTVVFDVRRASGACEGPWSLVIEGNTTSVTMM